jgi:hypothetical protein
MTAKRAKKKTGKAVKKATRDFPALVERVVAIIEEARSRVATR